MNRVQKKCLIASAGFHGLLVVVALFGSAFFMSKDKLDKSPTVEFITLDAKLIDGLTSGGGKLNSKPAPPAPRPTPVVAPPTAAKIEIVPPPPAPKPKPEPVKAKVVPTKPQKEEIVKEPEPKDKGFEPIPKPTKKKDTIQVDPTKLVVRNDADTKRRAEAAKEKANQEREQREYAAALRQAQLANAARLKGAFSKIQSGLSSGTDVEPPGPGGLAFIDYSQFVKKVYDEAWIAPGDGADDSATVKVSVTIARSGQVISSEIVKRSGSVVLDNSIDRVLKRVRFVAAFPEGTKDSQRTFIINFVLNAKRLSG